MYIVRVILGLSKTGMVPPTGFAPASGLSNAVLVRGDQVFVTELQFKQIISDLHLIALKLSCITFQVHRQKLLAETLIKQIKEF